MFDLDLIFGHQEKPNIRIRKSMSNTNRILSLAEQQPGGASAPFCPVGPLLLPDLCQPA
jgi:hypothetical protein